MFVITQLMTRVFFILSDGLIIIGYTIENDFAIAWVEDNGSDVDTDYLSDMNDSLVGGISEHHTGLKNINQRLILKYGMDNGLRFTKSDIGGVRVEIRIPLKSQE